MIKDDSFHKKILFYSIELAIAAVILWFDQRAFFLLCYISFMWKMDNNQVALLKSSRIQTIGLGTRLIAITNHLDIPEAKIDEEMNKLVDKLPPDLQELFQKRYWDLD